MRTHCTRESIRELDRRAIEEYGMPGVVLMENAGRGAASVAGDMIGDPAEKSVVIFCGKGNNGGDGYVVGRHLHNRGARVQIVLACKAEDVDPASDAGINLAILQHIGLPLLEADAQDGQLDAAGRAGDADLIVDALFGTGLSGEVRDPYLSLIRLINAADRPVLSIDIPSGLDANTGEIHGECVRADRTVTFVLPKVGFREEEGPGIVGHVSIVDIGVPVELEREIGDA